MREYKSVDFCRSDTESAFTWWGVLGVGLIKK